MKAALYQLLQKEACCMALYRCIYQCCPGLASLFLHVLHIQGTVPCTVRWQAEACAQALRICVLHVVAAC